MHHLVGQALHYENGEARAATVQCRRAAGPSRARARRARAAGRRRSRSRPARSGGTPDRAPLAGSRAAPRLPAGRARVGRERRAARARRAARRGRQLRRGDPAVPARDRRRPEGGPRGSPARPLSDRRQAIRRGGAHASTRRSSATRTWRRRSSSSRSRATTRRTSPGARTALDAARPGLSGDARFQLYDGLVLLREGKRSEGIAALERARQIDPKMVEPTASYIAGPRARERGRPRPGARVDGARGRDRPERPLGHGGAHAARPVGVLARPQLLGRGHRRLRVRQQRGAARAGRRPARPTSPTRPTGARSGTRTPATSS